MRCRLHHAPRIARCAHTEPVARIHNQKLLRALLTARACKLVRWNATFQILAQVALYVRQNRLCVVRFEEKIGDASDKIERFSKTIGAKYIPSFGDAEVVSKQ